MNTYNEMYHVAKICKYLHPTKNRGNVCHLALCVVDWLVVGGRDGNDGSYNIATLSVPVLIGWIAIM